MQKKANIIIILSAIFVTLIAIGGYIWMKHEEKQTFIKDQEIRITEFYLYNVPSFKAITFTGNRTLPTGSVSIYGYINSNKKLSFSATISLGSGEKNFEADGGLTDELDQLMRKDLKTVSQIEKIEKEQKENSKSE